jgi:micrococcal nuclease
VSSDSSLAVGGFLPLAPMKRSVPLLIVVALALAACGSSIGASSPTPKPEAKEAHATATPRATTRPRTTPAPTAEPTTRSTPAPEPTPAVGEAPSGPTEIATVVRITDGDTIRVLIDGSEHPVRYIGIDTPEVHGGVEPMGLEASQANADLLAGKQVVLEKDVSETDRYGRLLRYVWVEDADGWLLVNLELLRRGFAQVTTYPPDVKYVDALYLPAQAAAREAGLGVWRAPPSTPSPAAGAPAPSNCEPSYPDVCIPVGSADVDCPDLDARRFSVLWNVANPDPHRFDGDGDGIGCET